MEYFLMNNRFLAASLFSISLISCGASVDGSAQPQTPQSSSTALTSSLASTSAFSQSSASDAIPLASSSQLASEISSATTSPDQQPLEAQALCEESFTGANANHFYTNYRVNAYNQSFYRKAGGNPAFINDSIKFEGARFTIGEAGRDLDLSQPWTLSFDVLEAGGSGKVQIYVDNSSTSGERIFNQNANTLVVGERFYLQVDRGTTASYLQIRAESSASLRLDNLRLEYTTGPQTSSG